MKANKAPEKLYVDVRDNLSDSILYGFTEKRTDEDIEYTRTDALIEKACDAYCWLCDTKECGDTGECKWVEKFRKRLMR